MDQHVDQRHAAALGSTVQGGVAKLGLYRLCVYESKYRPSGDYITCTRRTLKNKSLDKLAMDFMDVKQLTYPDRVGVRSPQLPPHPQSGWDCRWPHGQ